MSECHLNPFSIGVIHENSNTSINGMYDEGYRYETHTHRNYLARCKGYLTCISLKLPLCERTYPENDNIKNQFK